MDTKVVCDVILDCEVKTEPVVIKKYGIETIYAVDVEFQSTKTKKGVININYSNSIGIDLHVGDKLNVIGDLRSIKIENQGTNKDEFPYYRKVYVLVRNIEKLDEFPEVMQNVVNFSNIVIYSLPKQRKSYADETIDITSFVVKYERNNDKSSYLYCVAWYSLARLIAKLDKGAKIEGQGNLQSRYSHDCLYNEICISSVNEVVDEA